jgi:NAD+ kinase
MKIFINADSFKEIALKTKDDLIRYCEELDIEIASDISEADILFSIGGDGTFLNTAKMTDRPIIGINTGTLGYLTEVKPDDLQKALKSAIPLSYKVLKFRRK